MNSTIVKAFRKILYKNVIFYGQVISIHKYIIMFRKLLKLIQPPGIVFYHFGEKLDGDTKLKFMLSSIYIKNFAIIDEIEIDFMRICLF